jgi:hypothetical protein
MRSTHRVALVCDVDERAPSGGGVQIVRDRSPHWPRGYAAAALGALALLLGPAGAMGVTTPPLTAAAARPPIHAELRELARLERAVRRDHDTASRLQSLDARVTKVEGQSSNVFYAFVSGAVLVVLGQFVRWGIEHWTDLRDRDRRSQRVVATLVNELAVLDDAIETNLALVDTELGEIDPSGTSIGRGATAPLLPLEIRSLGLLITDDPPDVIREQPVLLSDVVSLQTVAAYANSLGVARGRELTDTTRHDDARIGIVDEQLLEQFRLVREKAAVLKKHLVDPAPRTLP